MQFFLLAGEARHQRPAQKWVQKLFVYAIIPGN